MGITAIDIYGLSEVMGPGVASECVHQNGLHVFEDHFLIEILDPETLEPLPDGEYGEVVFTTLTKEGIPVVRYRTRDISRIIPGACTCGRTFRRMERITGRTDDMLIIRGVNVFPSQIEQVLAGVAGRRAALPGRADASGVRSITCRCRSRWRRTSASTRCVSSSGCSGRSRREIESALAVSIEVKLVEPKSIARSEGKAKRVVDLRSETEGA